MVDLGKWLREEYGAEYHGSSEPDLDIGAEEIGPSDECPADDANSA